MIHSQSKLLRLLLFNTLVFTHSFSLADTLKTGFSHAKLLNKAQLSTTQAEIISAACVDATKASKTSSIAVAVFDTGGSLLAFRRMDGVARGIVDTAMNKGRGAALFGFPTREMRNWAISNASVTLLPGFSGLTGGVPIKSKAGELLGGIGVSGMSSDDDEACALAAIKTIEDSL